ncbi:Cytosolic Fe-S cluster assembly factor NUBP2-like protein [Armadillidium vulgare]|nr:Cytosolic Fe-S cluster assembly factor NUBP2-like protein [Armadillidium vulgare]
MQISEQMWDNEKKLQVIAFFFSGKPLEGVGEAILVLSEKCRVGKSTITVQIASSIKMLGHKVGILDLDLCGPSIPVMVGVEGCDVLTNPDGTRKCCIINYYYKWKLHKVLYSNVLNNIGVSPCSFKVKSLTDNLKADLAFNWAADPTLRFTKFWVLGLRCKFNGGCLVIIIFVSAMIKQLLTNIAWDVDYLVINTPPGTSDEHISVMENIRDCPVKGAVLVTIPQMVAVDDFTRGLIFCRKNGIKDCSNIFATGRGQKLAEKFGVPFLGKAPIYPSLTK